MTYEEYGVWLERHVANSPDGEGRSMLKMCLENFRDIKGRTYCASWDSELSCCCKELPKSFTVTLPKCQSCDGYKKSLAYDSLEGELKLLQKSIPSGAIYGHDISLRLNEILSRHQEEKPRESLAELADRKGLWVIEHGPYRMMPWQINFHKMDASAILTAFNGKTYQEAEQKAKQYLEGLPDVK